MSSLPNVLGWSIDDHLSARRSGISAVDAITAVLDAIDSLDDPAVLIGGSLRATALADAAVLDAIDPSERPLHGVPFLVKDNIDVAGASTTCAFPSRSAAVVDDAAVVARLRAAGAIPVGKTNLDQFATGLVGTRSPYGTPRNPIDPSLVPGGSSSGSAVGVARGLVPFALGTDTAGSGRVPAALCGIVGLKPTLGRLPSVGMVPAVRRIDCPTVFARTVGDARLVASLAAGHRAGDPYSLPPADALLAVRRVGVLASSSSACSLLQPDALRAYEGVVALATSKGFEVIELDLDDFLAAGKLLYGGPFVAERTTSIGSYFETGDAGADPIVRSIVVGGATLRAIDAYIGEYALAELRDKTSSTWDGIDAMLLPTTPGVATLDGVAAEPISVNAWLGTFTTFTNLLNLAAIAVPVGRRDDGAPFGVQLIGPAWSDEALADAAAFLLDEDVPSSSTLRLGEIAVVVVGAHLSGMPLNWQLTNRGARLLRASRTAPSYRFFALSGTVPPKPGLQRVASDGVSIDVEVWALGAAAFGSFVTDVPPPLAIGTVELEDGTWVKGFVCEPIGLDGALDISIHGGWRAYIRSLSASPTSPS